MCTCRLTTMIAPLLLVAGASAYAGNSPPPAAPANPPLDVTMRVVPLNADIEKSVVQTIVVPMNVPAAKFNWTSPRAGATAGKSPAAPRVPNITVGGQARALRQASEARREAAEAAKEARKDRDNSSTKEHNPTSPV
jgi:hypothetical protein